MLPLPLPRFILVGLVLSAAAQAADFRALSWEQAIPGVSFAGTARAATFSISPDRFTKWQTVPTSQKLLEFRQKPEEPSPATPGAPPVPALPPPVIGTLTWPEGVERALLIFIPNPPGAAIPYSVAAIPEPSREATPPALRLFNYSTQFVAVKTGSGPVEELPPSSSLISNERPANAVSLLLMAEKTAAGWRAVVNKNIALPPDRTAYFFVRNAKPDPLEPNRPIIDYKLIYDRIAPRPAAEAKP